MNEETKARMQEVKEKLFKEAKGMTIEDLPAFLKKLPEYVMTDDIELGYEMAVETVAAAAVAAAWAMNKVIGLTGFQASCVNWAFLRQWYYSSNKCGMKLIDFDNMLYPQYAYKFDKVISKSVWEQIQKQAAENLKSPEFAALEVIKHWRSIVHGIVPFGYVIER